MTSKKKKKPPISRAKRPRQRSDGRKLGQEFQRFIDAELVRVCCLAGFRGEVAPLAQWTQPKYIKTRGQWVPAGKGWLDLVLWLPGGEVVTVDLKAVDMAAPKNRNSWCLDDKMRRDREGTRGGSHQIQKIDRLSDLGHRAGALVGAKTPGVFSARQSWDLYVVPPSVDFARPSIPWEEMGPYRAPWVDGVCRWWEVL